MSFTNPGDGVRCDHCDRPGTLYANQGERLCLPCLTRSVDAAPISYRDEYGTVTYRRDEIPAFTRSAR